MTCRVPVAVPCRGLPTSYDFVWLSIFAWGVGSSVLNLLITIWALDYFGRERGPACKPACSPPLPPSVSGPHLAAHHWAVPLLTTLLLLWAHLPSCPGPRAREIMTEQAYDVHTASRAGGNLETINK